MSLRSIFLIVVSVISLPALADGDVRWMLNDGVWRSDCNCMHNSQLNDFHNLFHNVGIIGSDDRRNLSAAADSLGLADIQDKLGNNGGVVVCPNPDPKKDPLVSSASLVGDGSYILTVAHAFFLKVNKAGKKSGTDLRKYTCFFQSEGQAPQQAILNFSDKSSILGTTGDHGYIDDKDPRDFAVIKLNKVVHGSNPFPLHTGPLQPGTQVLAVAGFQADTSTNKFITGQPIVQMATVRDTVASSNERDPSKYYSDADEVPAASGGAIYVKQKGQWQLAGIIAVSGLSKPGEEEGKISYSIKDGNFTRIVPIQGDLKEVLLNLPGANPVD